MFKRLSISSIVVVTIVAASCYGPLDPYDPAPSSGNDGNSPSSPTTQTALAAYWKCNDSAGTKLADKIAGAHGEIFGAVFDSGVESSALKFNGSDDMVEITTSGSKTFDIGTGEFTISLWVKPKSYQYADTIRYAILSNGAALDRGFTLAVYENRFSLFLGKNASGSKDTLFKAKDEKWRHIVLLRRKSVVELYVNTKQTQTLSYDFDLTGTDGKWRIGDDASSRRDNQFAGKIDEIQFTRTAWDMTKINSEYNLYKKFTE